MAGGEPIYAVDVSVWPRCDAETSPERGLYYHSSRHSAGQPIVAGWAYSWIAQLSFARESWTAPLRVRRLRPQENANAVAAEQIAAFLPHLPADSPLPGSSSTPATTRSSSLKRWADDACRHSGAPALRALFLRRPDHPAAHGTAAPSWRQVRLRCARRPGPPPRRLTVEDEQYGTVRVRAWTGLHPKTQASTPSGDARGRRPIVRGTLSARRGRAACPSTPASRKRSGSGGIAPRPASLPNLDRAWRAYVRRFDLEHTFRFLKQTLNWTLPRVRHPEQADRWTWLVVLAYTQLRLARPLVADQPLPWQRPQPAGKLTPDTGPTGVFALLSTAPDPGLRAKTLRTLSRTPQRQALGPGDALSGHHQGPPQRLPSRLNQTASSSSRCQRLLPRLVARLLMVKSQANTHAQLLLQHIARTM